MNTSPSPAPLVTRALTKRFEGHLALNNLSLTLPAGRVAGLLGRNGAGKTTCSTSRAG